jgi:hypothetical protein
MIYIVHADGMAATTNSWVFYTPKCRDCRSYSGVKKHGLCDVRHTQVSGANKDRECWRRDDLRLLSSLT